METLLSITLRAAEQCAVPWRLRTIITLDVQVSVIVKMSLRTAIASCIASHRCPVYQVVASDELGFKDSDYVLRTSQTSWNIRGRREPAVLATEIDADPGEAIVPETTFSDKEQQESADERLAYKLQQRCKCRPKQPCCETCGIDHCKRDS